MNEGFEFTLHASNSPAFGRFSRQFAPARGRFWPSHAWGGSPTARWASPGARGRWLTPACVVVTRRRGRTGRQEEEAAAEEEWRKRESVVGGGIAAMGKEIKGTRNYQFAPPFSLSFIRQSKLNTASLIRNRIPNPNR